MKKVLLLCLTALVCCVTGAWAQTGTGTQDDPVIAEVGGSITVNNSTDFYVEFTAPSNGRLWLERTNGFTSQTFRLYVKGSSEMLLSTNYDFLTQAVNFDYDMTGGTTYTLVIPSDWLNPASITYTVHFDEAGEADPNALTVVSADPAAGSSLAGLSETTPITVVLNKAVGYIDAQILGGSGSTEVYSQLAATTTDGGTTWTLTPYSDLTLYEGTTYTVTLRSYESYEAVGNPANIQEETSFTYTGTSEALVYSDIHIVSITPDPNNTSDMENMISSTNPILTVEFSGDVLVQECAVGEGQGMGTIPVEYTLEGSTLTVDLSSVINSSRYSLMLNISVTDTEGNPLSGEGDDYDFSTATSTYVIDVPVADGRTIDMSLYYNTLAPEGNYVQSIVNTEDFYLESLGAVNFTVRGGGDSDGFYSVTSAAVAGLYDAEGTKVADVVLSQAEFGSNSFTATVCELGTETPAAVTTPGVYTMKIDSLSIGDGNFDPTAPWLSGNTGVGRCNPTWRWAFTVVDKLVTVTNVTPAPYSETGEFNETLPAQIEVEFSSSDVTVAAVTATYGMGLRTPLDYAMTDNKLTISVSEVLQEEHSFNITVVATAASGQPVQYGDIETAGLDVIALGYERPAGELELTFSPESGSTVESLSRIDVSVDESLIIMITSFNALDVVDAQGAVVATASVDFFEDYKILNRAVIFLSETITAPGTYSIVLPAGLFTNDYSTMINTEQTLTYTVAGGTGIEGVTVADGTNVKVYTIDGLLIGEGKAAEVLGTLPKGVYVVNGKKVIK